MKKKMLITGASGFLGQALCEKYQNDYHIIAISRNHKNLFALKKLCNQIDIYPCDVANTIELEKIFIKYKPNIVIHAAATKFVDWAEQFPSEAVTNNVYGSKNVLDFSIKYGADKIIAVSTDKAAPPIKNLYGLTKATMEKLFTLSATEENHIVCVRYGNVLWSTGSVLPVWKNMHDNKQVIQTTGPEMTRFFFSINDAVDLIDFALSNSSQFNGKVLSKKMKSCKIIELLKAFCEKYTAQYEKTELRPGERNYEVLVAQSEAPFSEVVGDNYILIHLNAKQPIENHLSEEYTTENSFKFTHEELLKLV